MTLLEQEAAASEATIRYDSLTGPLGTQLSSSPGHHDLAATNWSEYARLLLEN